MSAELLRRAATGLREDAEVKQSVAPHLSDLYGDDCGTEHDARFALAVADTLERIAVQHGPIIECGNSGCRGRGLSGMHCDDPCEQAHEDCLEWRDALAVARTYLGEPA